MEKKEKIKTGLERKVSRRANGSIRIQHFNHDPSLTNQDEKDDCDVNVIIEKAMKGQTITHLSARTGVYMDLSEVPDFEKSLNIIAKAKSAFAELPAHLREKFHNDPKIMMEYLADPRNNEEAIELGLKEIKAKTHDEQVLESLGTIANSKNDESNDEQNSSSTKAP